MSFPIFKLSTLENLKNVLKTLCFTIVNYNISLNLHLNVIIIADKHKKLRSQMASHSNVQFVVIIKVKQTDNYLSID